MRQLARPSWGSAKMRTWQLTLDVPVHGLRKVHIVTVATSVSFTSHCVKWLVVRQYLQSHAAIAGPAPLVGVRTHSLIIRVGVCRQVPLNEFSCFFRRELEKHVDLVDVTGVESHRVTSLGRFILELQEPVGELRRTGDLGRTLQAENE